MAIGNINDLPASLPSSVSCSLYADDLAIWSFFLLVPTALEATQGALFRLERWYWYLPLNSSKCEASFSVDLHQAILQPNLLLFNSHLRFNPTPTFPGVTIDRTLSFSKHVSSLKAKFFAHLKALRCISASSWGPSKDSLSLLYKAFLCFTRMVSFLKRSISSNWNAFTGRLIAPSPAASHPPLSHFSSLGLLFLTLTHFALSFYKRALRFPNFFPILGLARHGVRQWWDSNFLSAGSITKVIFFSRFCYKKSYFFSK